MKSTRFQLTLCLTKGRPKSMMDFTRNNIHKNRTLILIQKTNSKREETKDKYQNPKIVVLVTN